MTHWTCIASCSGRLEPSYARLPGFLLFDFGYGSGATSTSLLALPLEKVCMVPDFLGNEPTSNLQRKMRKMRIKPIP